MGKGEVVAVLGAGHGGHATAADLALMGAEVRLYAIPGFSRKLAGIQARGGIELRGIGRTGQARVAVTTDLAEAVTGAAWVFVATVAQGHERLAALLAPHLRDGQVVVFFTSYGGTLLLRAALRRLAHPPRVLVGETVTLPYFCRLTGPAQVELSGKPYKALPLAAVPADETAALVARVQPLYPMVRPAASVLETMLLNPNVLRHTTGTLLNIGRIEYAQGAFWLHREAFTPSVWRVLDRLDAEKMALMAALGLRPLSYRDYRRMVNDLTLEEQAALDLKGPADAETRYLTEDVPMGLVPRAELGDRLGVAVPTHRALIHLASIVNGRDHAAEGRTLARLGLGNVEGAAIRDAVDRGAVRIVARDGDRV